MVRRIKRFFFGAEKFYGLEDLQKWWSKGHRGIMAISESSDL